MNKLIEFWEKLDTERKLLVHPEDIDRIDLDSHYKNIDDYDDYINNNCSFGSDKNKFHLNLIPIPYTGDIEDAKIYILTLNPGFEILDYYAESKDREFKEALINNLRQKLDVNYPFIFLNPKFLWHGGGQYWEKKLKNVINEVTERFKNPEDFEKPLGMLENTSNIYKKALSYVAKKIAVLELVPYHSKSYNLPNKKFKNLQSPKIMTDFVKKELLPKAKKSEKCIICTRGSKSWDLTDDNNVIVYNKKEARGAHISSKSRGWEKILEFLWKS